MNQPEHPDSRWTVPMPDEQSQAALIAAFRQTVDDAIAWATTEGKRDQVMNALYDILNEGVDVGDAAVYIYSSDDEDEPS